MLNHIKLTAWFSLAVVALVGLVAAVKWAGYAGNGADAKGRMHVEPIV